MVTNQITDKLTPFEIQIIDDLWEDYMYNTCNLNDDDVYQCDSDDIEHFREWLYVDHSIIAFNLYLPESDSELANIVKYCIEHTKQ